MRRLALLLPLFALAAHAEDSPEQTLFTAEIVSARTQTPAPGARLLVTEVELVVRSCLRGPCPERTTVRVPGGRYGDIEQWVEDWPTPVAGAIVAVTLPPSPPSARTQRFARLSKLEDLATSPPLTPASPRSVVLPVETEGTSGSASTSPSSMTRSPGR